MKGQCPILQKLRVYELAFVHYLCKVQFPKNSIFSLLIAVTYFTPSSILNIIEKSVP